MTTEEIRTVSKALLGNRYRLEVATAIHREEGQSFFAQEIADITGVRYPRVQQELRHLLDAGWLREAEGGARTVEYKAVDSIYWQMCAELLDELQGR